MDKFPNIWIKNLKKRYEIIPDKKIMTLIGEKINEIEQTQDYNVGHMINEGDTDILIIYTNDVIKEEKSISIEIWKINKATKDLKPTHPFITYCKGLVPERKSSKDERELTKNDFI